MGIPRLISHYAGGIPNVILGPDLMEEFRPTSGGPELMDADIFSIILRRLRELEEKVRTLQTNPMQMPFEKEELLNGAIRRVDGLEAELITTKKVPFPLIVLLLHDNYSLKRSIFLYCCEHRDV